MVWETGSVRAVGLVTRADTPPIDECAFYHAIELPDVGVRPWHWDLRGRVDEYLGGVDLAGMRVLEVGPASGFLTAAMEDMGADVLALELPEHHAWDFVPQATLDREEVVPERVAGMRMLRNGFWFAHAALGLRAKVFYGSVDELPPDDEFDVSVLAAVLLHTRDALGMLEACAARTRETLVVVERPFAELVPSDRPLCGLIPSAENEIWDTWWTFSPAFIAQFCELMGFREIAVTTHTQQHVAGPVDMFTVVASRGTR
jgi:hypothetical protein